MPVEKARVSVLSNLSQRMVYFILLFPGTLGRRHLKKLQTKLSLPPGHREHPLEKSWKSDSTAVGKAWQQRKGKVCSSFKLALN